MAPPGYSRVGRGLVRVPTYLPDLPAIGLKLGFPSLLLLVFIFLPQSNLCARSAFLCFVAYDSPGFGHGSGRRRTLSNTKHLFLRRRGRELNVTA